MLVFSRKLGEKFYIGNNVTVTVVEITGGRVRLGIDAPKDIDVDRAEVREQQVLQMNTLKHRVPRQGLPIRKDCGDGHPIRKRA